MSINFQEILKELEYRVEHGIIDLTKEEQVTKLVEILRENGISDANEMAQKARVYFSYLNEDDIVKNKKSGNIYVVGKMDPTIHDIPSSAEINKAKKANGGELPKDKTTSKPAGKAGTQKTAPKADIGVSDAEKNKDKKTSGTKPVDVERGVVVVASTGRYGTKGSKELDQKRANNRLKALPPSGISTKQAMANFKKRFPNGKTTNYEYPKEVAATLKAKLPPAGYDSLLSLLKMSKQGKFAPPISDVTDQYGAGQVSAQANELAMQAVFCFPNTPQGLKQRGIFIQSLLDNEAAHIKAGGTPILDKSWIKHLVGAHDAFIKNMNREHGVGKWEVTGMTWDVRAQQEALGANYNEKGDSTDINAQVKSNGKIQNVEISCKKDWKIFLLNAGLGDAENWYYTLGSKAEARANELVKMAEAEDPRFGKKEQEELKTLSQLALKNAPVKNSELQSAQMKSANNGFTNIREIPSKDLNGAIKACLGKGANDYYGIADTDVPAVKLVAKYLATHDRLDPDEFREFMGTKSEKEFKKAVLMYNKVLAEYTGDHKWVDGHRKITSDFILDASNKIATNKQFQGMLLRKLQEAIPIKSLVEGVETMQIDSMYIGREHMKKIFGTDNWDEIKQFLTIKVKDGVASLTYIAKGKKPTKPIKLAEIDLREKGVGYNGAVGLECQPSADFEAACKQAEEELNRGKQ
jgi:hypothetical protein